MRTKTLNQIAQEANQSVYQFDFDVKSNVNLYEVRSHILELYPNMCYLNQLLP